MNLEIKDLENIITMCDCWIENNIFYSNGELSEDEIQQNSERYALKEKAQKELTKRQKAKEFKIKRSSLDD